MRGRCTYGGGTTDTLPRHIVIVFIKYTSCSSDTGVLPGISSALQPAIHRLLSGFHIPAFSSDEILTIPLNLVGRRCILPSVVMELSSASNKYDNIFSSLNRVHRINLCSLLSLLRVFSMTLQYFYPRFPPFSEEMIACYGCSNL